MGRLAAGILLALRKATYETSLNLVASIEKFHPTLLRAVGAGRQAKHHYSSPPQPFIHWLEIGFTVFLFTNIYKLIIYKSPLDRIIQEYDLGIHESSSLL